MRRTFETEIKAAGGLTVIAGRLGEELPTVSNWMRRGVPVARCAAFEAAVDRSVRRWDLRPDDWHRIWPELIGQLGAPPVPAATQPINQLKARDAA